MSKPSVLEYDVCTYLGEHPFHKQPHPVCWATEVAPFLKHEEVMLVNCKVDVVMCGGVSATTKDMKCSVLVFLDGSGHFPCRSGRQPRSNRCAEEQRTIDKAISIGAASAGFKILRVAEDDAWSVLRMIEAAWKERHDKSGWVKVSSRWNSGAYRKATVKVRRD